MAVISHHHGGMCVIFAAPSLLGCPFLLGKSIRKILKLDVSGFPSGALQITDGNQASYHF